MFCFYFLVYRKLVFISFWLVQDVTIRLQLLFEFCSLIRIVSHYRVQSINKNFICKKYVLLFKGFHKHFGKQKINLRLAIKNVPSIYFINSKSQTITNVKCSINLQYYGALNLKRQLSLMKHGLSLQFKHSHISQLNHTTEQTINNISITYFKVISKQK